MRGLLTIFVLSICTASIAGAQSRDRHRASLTPAQIRQAQQRLSDLGYWTSAVDGRFDSATQSALVAFQKWEGRPVTGQLTIDEFNAIQSSASPKAREAGYEHAEVDLDHQVFMWVDRRGSFRVLPVSTGTGNEYVDGGQTSVAYTPRGRFLVYDKGFGWEKGPLGSVYYPNGISGGIAIHGSRNVPNQPASHGCIRVPMFAAREVSKLLKLGTIVLVYDKVSFVSAKEWVENPKLKEAALLNIAASDDEIEIKGTRDKNIKKVRTKVIRA